MSRGLKTSVSYLALFVALALPPAAAEAAPTESVIYNFQGPPNDGSYPAVNLLLDKTGQLYGTTSEGGSAGCLSSRFTIGCGTAFRLTPPASGSAWSETALYSFPVTPDRYPQFPNALTYAGAISGQPYDGTSPLYGTVANGGPNGSGYVFTLVPPANGKTTWTVRRLWTFGSISGDGENPGAGLLMPNSTTLFGTTEIGGAGGNGTVFELTYNATTKQWTEQVIYNFAGWPSDGAIPASALLLDKTGQLYGTTLEGGSGGCSLGGFSVGCGVVYQIKP
jgi:hypothetical protein